MEGDPWMEDEGDPGAVGPDGQVPTMSRTMTRLENPSFIKWM